MENAMLLSPVYTQKTQCQDCYKCLRECPLKSIRVSEGVATIDGEDCVYCGHCTLICPAKAKRVRNDVPRLNTLLNSGEEIWLSLAPSFVAEFGDIEPEVLVGALKKLGFAGVSETALGADFVSRDIARQTREHPEQKLFISTACPSVVRYIERYVPNLFPYLVKCGSPLQLHSEFLRKELKRPIKVVFAGPCAAKKMESDRWPDAVALSLGFNEIRQLLEENEIKFSEITSAERAPFFPTRPSMGMMYPVDSGMCRSIQSFQGEMSEKLMYKSVSGLPTIIETFQGFNPDLLENPLFLELLACPGGCINGPMISKHLSLLSREVNVESAYNRYQKSPLPYTVEYAVNYDLSPIQLPEITPEIMTEALHQIGKYAPEDELNCSGCGYDSCRDFARALIQGRAEKNMCVSYMRKLANKKASMLMQSMPTGVALINRALAIVESNENFAKLLGEEAKYLFEITPGMEGAQLDKLFPEAIPYIKEMLENSKHEAVRTVVRKDKKVYQLTIFNIEKDELVGLFIQDCTDPYIRRDRVIEQARTVIEKNLSTVQNIAFLLGENAAESESILNSMIENFSGEGGGEES